MRNVIAMPTIDENEASRRRRAICRGLAPYLAEEKIVAALWVWQTQFAKGASFALHEFIKAVCDTPALQQRRNEIHRSLLTSMTLKLSELGPEPWPKMKAHKARALAQLAQLALQARKLERNSVMSEMVTVFAAVMAQCFQGLFTLNPQQHRRVTRYWTECVPAFDLDIQPQEMLNWIDGRSEFPLRAVALDKARRMLHTAYVLICEYQGAAIADRILAQAIERAEGLPQAKLFAPKALL